MKNFGVTAIVIHHKVISNGPVKLNPYEYEIDKYDMQKDKENVNRNQGKQDFIGFFNAEILLKEKKTHKFYFCWLYTIVDEWLKKKK
ncbi:MAG: hypothetical protein R2783_09825 [Gelidibacter sp.]